MEPVTNQEGKRGFYSEETGFIGIDQLQKVTNDKGVKGYYSEITGFVPAPNEVARKTKETPISKEGLTARGFIEGAYKGAATLGKQAGSLMNAAISPVINSEFMEPIRQSASGLLDMGSGSETQKLQAQLSGSIPTAPKSAEVMSEAMDIANLLPIAGVGKYLGGKLAQAEITAAQPLGKVLGRAAKTAEAGVQRKIEQDAIDIISKDIKVMSKAEKKLALKSGDVSKSGIFKGAKIKTTPEDLEMAKSVEGLVEKRANPVTNIDKIRTGIEEYARQTEQLPGMNNTTIDKVGLNAALENSKLKSKVIFAGDTNLENSYSKMMGEFYDILATKPDTLNGVLQARRDYDVMVKQNFPYVFDRIAGDNVKANAIRDVRMAVNDFVANELPDGNRFKELLKQQNNMFKSIDRIAEKYAPVVGDSTAKKIINVAKEHPWLTVGALAGAGSMLPLLSNPVVLPSLIAYGTYKVGKETITSLTARKMLSRVLRYGEKVFTVGEKKEITKVIDTLSNADKAKKLRSPTYNNPISGSKREIPDLGLKIDDSLYPKKVTKSSSYERPEYGTRTPMKSADLEVGESLFPKKVKRSPSYNNPKPLYKKD